MSPLLLCASIAAASSQSVHIVVQLDASLIGSKVRVSTTWLGEDRAMDLVDTGPGSGGDPEDGLYVGDWSGAPVRVLPVRLTLQAPDGTLTPIALYNEALDAETHELAYAIAGGDTPSVRRVATAGSSRAAEIADLSSTAAALGWTGLVLGWVAWLVGRSVPAR